MDGIVKVQDGHIFETEDGMMKTYEMGDMHDGPHCLICDNYWCRNCNDEIFTEICPGRSEPTLEGLEYRQPKITGIVGRRIPL